MPRIDPLQLLKCLSVLLSPEGGIMSREEVPRLVNLMTKFSKKLVSKCVYLLILKSTDVTLVDMFMASGGWLLIHTWLQEAMACSNWNLVQEVLELLLVTPVDSSRLRLNNIPKLVKTLSKREDLGDVKDMAALLVNNWLAIVKNSTPPIQDSEKQSEKPTENPIEINEVTKEEMKVEAEAEPEVANEIETVELPEAPVMEEDPVKMETEEEDSISTGMFYKITVRDGKQVITKLANTDELDDKQIGEETEISSEKDLVKKEEDTKENKPKKEESKSKSSSSSSSKSKSGSSSSSKKSSSSSSSRSSNSSKDKDKKYSSSSKNVSKSSSSSSSKDKDKERSRKDKDKENDKDKQRNNGSLKNSSSSSSKSSSSSSSSSKDKDKDKKDSKEPKEKQAEKDKDTLAKLKPVSLDKIGRIPKKTTSDDKDVEGKKKPSMSIEPKKKAEDRPKTVKIFNSKMRSTGLEEEVKPPPPRNAIKKPSPVIPPTLPIKRPSPPRDILATPPEKKLKIEIPERAGAIKLIPPKPKPPVLLESDIFMDALTAATSKKEPKKRKRRLSVSKESPENSPTVQPPSATSPLGLKNFSPANFYQDTLETADAEEPKEEKTEEVNEEKPDVKEIKDEIKEDNPVSDVTSEVSEPSTRTNSDGLKGVLVYLKKKGPKRSITWKEEKDLVEIRFFELDETERVNVSRTNFNDMAKLEMTNEREALMGRKLMNEDLMEPTTLWRIPYLVDQPDLPVQPGSKSLEKDIQYAREKNILQALYFNKSLIPDTPADPIPETHPMVDPVIIPLEDAESQSCDLRNTPWPEPKGMAPVEPPPINIPPMFQNIPGPFPNFPQMGPQGFPGMPGPMPGPGMPGPGFCPPNMIPNGPNMMPNNMNLMGNPNMNMGAPMDMMNQGPMNPNMFVPGVPNMDNFNPMMNENPSYPMPYNQPNMYGPPNNNFNNMERGGAHRGRGGFRGRGHNNNNWGRNGARGNNWRNNRDDHRGGTGRICKNVKNHGYCRNIDNCPFVHPN